MVFPYYLYTEEMVLHMLETFNWWEMDSVVPPLPPYSLLPNYQMICQDFVKADVEEVARDLQTPKIIQVTFYIMIINDTIEPGFLPQIMARALRDALVHLS